PPSPHAPHLGSDDRFRKQEQPEQHEAEGEPPVDHLRLGQHQRSRSSSNPRARKRWKSRPARTTKIGGSERSHQKPWPCGGSSVIRSGCATAQTSPASEVA